MNTKQLTDEEMRNTNGGKPVAADDPNYINYLQDKQEVSGQSDGPGSPGDPGNAGASVTGMPEPGPAM